MTKYAHIFWIETPEEVELEIEVTIGIDEDPGDEYMGPTISYWVDDYRLLKSNDTHTHTKATLDYLATYDFEKLIEDEYGEWITDYCDYKYCDNDI